MIPITPIRNSGNKTADSVKKEGSFIALPFHCHERAYDEEYKRVLKSFPIKKLGWTSMD